ncbi:hypothetical protein KKB73_03720, partial [Patescibacteria group bacterium]|nr:hypothetical protein [Patescibacteria group bacterium]
DCECSIKGEYDCSIAGSGTNYNNQYRCVNCLWSGGWCGDNVIQTTYEECDHNDKGGFKFETSKNECSSDLDGDGYADYLHGSLDCLDNNSGSKCKFKVTACSDNLYDDGVNTPHTKQQCISAGGVVVSDSATNQGDEVTDRFGNIIDPNKVGNSNKNYFCKFGGSWSGDPALASDACQSKGIDWERYENWSTTISNDCIKTCSLCCGDGCYHARCDTLFHSSFENHVETCTGKSESYKCVGVGGCSACSNCGSYYISCTAYATVKKIGCY